MVSWWEGNDIKTTQKFFSSNLWPWQFSYNAFENCFLRLSYKVMDFITNMSLYFVPIHWLSSLPVLMPIPAFGWVNSCLSDCANPDTSQGSVSPSFCLHTLQLPLYRCLLFFRVWTIPVWHSRVGSHPWGTVGATGRHSWKCGLQWKRQHESSRTVLCGLVLLNPITEILGGKEEKIELWWHSKGPNSCWMVRWES